MENLKKVILVDDHPMVLDGLKALIGNEKSLEVIGTFTSGKDAIEFVQENQVDLIVTDISMPEMSGIELTRKVKSAFPHINVLVLTMHDNEEVIHEVFMTEAEGYVLKDLSPNKLIQAILATSEGQPFYSNKVIGVLQKKVKKQETKNQFLQLLTSRELEIVQLIIAEKSTNEIAEFLHISPRTVETHRKNIMVKTSSKTTIGLIKLAFSSGLVSQ